MAQTVSPVVSPTDRGRPSAMVEDRKRAQKGVQRARTILLSADRLRVLEVAARSGASRPSLWLWRQRFAAEGVAGLQFLLRGLDRGRGDQVRGEWSLVTMAWDMERMSALVGAT